MRCWKVGIEKKSTFFSNVFPNVQARGSMQIARLAEITYKEIDMLFTNCKLKISRVYKRVGMATAEGSECEIWAP